MDKVAKGVGRAVGRGLKASTKNPPHGNPFKDSVVQDPVFHGTTADFDNYIEGYGKLFKERGIHFTDNKDVARAFTGEPQIIKEAYLDIRNPLVVDASGAHWLNIKFEGKTIDMDDLANIARERGNDGVVVKNVSDVYPLRGNTYIALRPDQIKSSAPGSARKVGGGSSGALAMSLLGIPSPEQEAVQPAFNPIESVALGPGNLAADIVFELLSRMPSKQYPPIKGMPEMP